MKRCSFLAIVLLSLLSASASAHAHAHAHAHNWDLFHNLTGSRPGDSNPGIPALKKYLLHFGYYPRNPHNASASASAAPFTDTFDTGLLAALRAYQRFFKINATGALDVQTVNQLRTPRCCLPDSPNGATTMASGGGHIHPAYTFFEGKPKWPASRHTLTYSFYNLYRGLPAGQTKQAFANAFRRWAAASHFSFSEGKYPRTPITVAFYRGDHGDGAPFDGPLGCLAHAFAPQDGRLHMDEDEDWWTAGPATSERSIDMQSVAVHEIGHLLGLGHSMDEHAIMHPSYTPKSIKRNIGRDDINGIRALYGHGNAGD